MGESVGGNSPEVFEITWKSYPKHDKSINLFISSFDSIAETTMDFGLTFIMRLRWQDPRMMFPDIEGEKMLDNKTILTMDLKFLEELWVPGTC